MDSASAERPGRTPPNYQIVVRGEVTERFAELLEGVTVEPVGGNSILRMNGADQAKLHAVFGWLYDHGIELVSVRPVGECDPDGATGVAR